MSNKTYNQYCAIANALDTVGERWTLLVVRNLLLGPKRFSDLMKGLPGISTNILTERLKLLEERSVIVTRFLPPPAASNVYQLTEDGIALVDVLSALARWGSLTLGYPHEEQFIVPEGIGFMVLGIFRRSSSPEFNLVCNIHVQHDRYDQRFGMHLSPEGVRLTDEALSSVDVTLHIELERLSVLSSGNTRLAAMLQAHEVQLEGSVISVQRLIEWVDNR